MARRVRPAAWNPIHDHCQYLSDRVAVVTLRARGAGAPAARLRGRGPRASRREPAVEIDAVYEATGDVHGGSDRLSGSSGR